MTDWIETRLLAPVDRFVDGKELSRHADLALRLVLMAPLLILFVPVCALEEILRSRRGGEVTEKNSDGVRRGAIAGSRRESGR